MIMEKPDSIFKYLTLNYSKLSWMEVFPLKREDMIIKFGRQHIKGFYIQKIRIGAMNS